MGFDLIEWNVASRRSKGQQHPKESKHHAKVLANPV